MGWAEEYLIRKSRVTIKAMEHPSIFGLYPALGPAHRAPDRHDFARYKVTGDGNCQYRAMAHQIFDDEQLHPIVRAAGCSYIVQHSAHYQGFIHEHSTFSSWLYDMQQIGSWGDHLSLDGIANAYSRNIYIFTDKNRTISLGPQPGAVVAGAAYLYFTPERHYDSAVRIDALPQPPKRKISTRGEQHKSKKHRIIDNIDVLTVRMRSAAACDDFIRAAKYQTQIKAHQQELTAMPRRSALIAQINTLTDDMWAAATAEDFISAAARKAEIAALQKEHTALLSNDKD